MLWSLTFGYLIDLSRIPHMPKQTITCKRESPCKAYVSMLLHGKPCLHAIVCLGVYGIRERSIGHCVSLHSNLIICPTYMQEIYREIIIQIDQNAQIYTSIAFPSR